METEDKRQTSCAIKVVVQRCNSAQLLVDNESKWITVGRSLIFYVSFAEGAESKSFQDTVSTLLSLPLLSLGSWGDKTNKPIAFKKLVQQGEKVNILFVPQAGLVNKWKRGSLQYAGQLEKSESKRLYYHLVYSMQRAIDELGGKPPVQWQPKSGVPPEELFKVQPWEGQFSRFDVNHVPTHDSGGKLLSKSRRKKVLKVAEANMKKFTAGRQECAKNNSERDKHSVESVAPELLTAMEVKNDKHEYVKYGTFGNLQSLRVNSDCGPNTHIFEFS